MSFTVYNKRSNDLSDSEFLQLAEDFAKKYDVFHGIYDEGDRYRVDFYFNKTVIYDIESWLKLLGASDMHTVFTVVPERICTKCYRVKCV